MTFLPHYSNLIHYRLRNYSEQVSVGKCTVSLYNAINTKFDPGLS